MEAVVEVAAMCGVNVVCFQEAWSKSLSRRFLCRLQNRSLTSTSPGASAAAAAKSLQSCPALFCFLSLRI